MYFLITQVFKLENSIEIKNIQNDTIFYFNGKAKQNLRSFSVGDMIKLISGKIVKARKQNIKIKRIENEQSC